MSKFSSILLWAMIAAGILSAAGGISLCLLALSHGPAMMFATGAGAIVSGTITVYLAAGIRFTTPNPKHWGKW